MFLIADATNTAINAVISAAISALITVSVNLYMNRAHDKRMVYGFVQKIIEFGMTYPHLEHDAFCDSYPNISDDKEKQRYEHYCCHVFNTLEHVHELCSDGLTDATTILYPDEMIWRHRKWWHSDAENASGYTRAFRDYVNSVIEKKEALRR